MWVANKRMTVNGTERQPGDPLPEAITWSPYRLQQMIREGRVFPADAEYEVPEGWVIVDDENRAYKEDEGDPVAKAREAAEEAVEASETDLVEEVAEAEEEAQEASEDLAEEEDTEELEVLPNDTAEDDAEEVEEEDEIDLLLHGTVQSIIDEYDWENTDAETVEAIRDAEVAGKGRVTLLNHLNDVLAGLYDKSYEAEEPEA